MSEKKTSYVQIAFRILRMAFKAAPLWLAVDCIGMILSSSSFVLEIYALQYMFDTITTATQKGTSMGHLVAVIVMMVGVLIFNQLMNAICNFLAGPAALGIKGSFREQIHMKVERLPALHFENPETLDYIQKAKEGAGKGIELYHSVSTLLTFYGPYFIIMGIYFYHLRPLLTWCILFIFVPLLVSQVVKEKVFSRLIDESAPLERKVQYYEKELYKREYAKETRMLGIYSLVKSKYAKTLGLFSVKRWQAVKKVQLTELALHFLTLLGYMGVLLLLVDSLIGGHITIGGFAAVFASVGIMISFMDDAICNYLGEMLENYGALRNFVSFLDLPEEEGEDQEITLQKDIEVSGVSFCYPNSEFHSLENVSFHINKGETVAIVGENGAGKTTLVKIIAGILPPTEGTVFVDGVPLSSFSKKHRFKIMSGVIQKFGKYKITLKDNVSISDRGNPVELERIEGALEDADFRRAEKADKLAEGLDTMLSREFGGIDLSGGEWQRIALARGLYRESEIIVLDEPTSAIDPIEESLLYQKFRELTKGKTAIIVTHRLGSVKIADRIVVLDKGKLVGIGTHDQLLRTNEKYAEMFRAQARWYVDSHFS